jgi:hypothetical protein
MRLELRIDGGEMMAFENFEQLRVAVEDAKEEYEARENRIRIQNMVMGDHVRAGDSIYTPNLKVRGVIENYARYKYVGTVKASEISAYDALNARWLRDED